MSGASLRRAGLVVVLLGVCPRLVTTTDPLPGWSLDPFTTLAPHNGIGPALSVALAALPPLGLALVLLGTRREGRRVPRWPLALGILALPALLWHARLGPTASVENTLTLAAWLGAIAAGLAATIGATRRAERALIAAACAGLAGPMLLRSLVQVYIEHPELVEAFRADRPAFLAQHGWTEGSTSARVFERRLTQPDASAWLAMSNVYASVSGACGVVFLAGLIAALRARAWATGQRADRYVLAGLAGGSLCGLGGLVVALPAGASPAKGAIGAVLIGLALLGLGLIRAPTADGHRATTAATRPGRLALIGPGLIVLALLAVVARGVVGERIGELSLLFRWFYLQAAARVFFEHPLLGVGPDGFQAAYLLAKNPLSPEEVASPHSVLFDWLATLGVFGAAWGVLLLWWAARHGSALAAPAPPAEPESGRARDVRALTACLGVVVAGAGMVHLWCEVVPMARAAPPGAFGLLLLDGLTKLAAYMLLWLGLGAALLRTGLRAPGEVRCGLAAAAMALLMHAQIELTAVDPAACGWVLLMLGAAAGWDATLAGSGAPRRAGLVGGFVAGGLALAVLLAAWPVARWEAGLRASASEVADSTRLLERARDLGRGPDASTSGDPEAFLRDLEAALGRPLERRPGAVGEALDEVRLDRARLAARQLDRLARDPGSPSRATAHEAVGTFGRAAQLLIAGGADPAPDMRRGLDLAEWAAARWPWDARAWRDLANTIARAREAGVTGEASDTEAELAALERASELDPFSPELAYRLAIRRHEAGREARALAERALRLHERSRLDPLAGLSAEQVQTLRELVGSP